MTLEDALQRNRGVGPGFHMLRHVLAFMIFAHHCRIAVIFQPAAMATTGFDKDVSGGGSPWVHIAGILFNPILFSLVGMFFALSGFLVTGSALRNNSVKVFFANRALRILPALSVEVGLAALILGPIVTAYPLSAYFSDPQFFRYFANIVGHITFQLPGVFLTNPWRGVVNANLWTLPPEFWCYFFMLLMMASGTLLHKKRVTIAIISTVVIALMLSIFDPVRFAVRQDTTHFTAWYVVMMFLFGVLFLINARHILLNKWIFVACAAAYYLLMIFDKLGPISGLFLTYCMVYIGMFPARWFDKFIKQDISYGTYLYGFPIIQLTVYCFLDHLSSWGRITSFLIVFAVSFPATLAFSTLSWIWIERPALRLRKYVLREPPSVGRGNKPAT
jgi:peptidoglycan/LPS O-acetylase OafA/YrhL